MTQRAIRKVYTTNATGTVRVPEKEITLQAPEKPLRLYDCSGPHTDPAAQIDPAQGLDGLRASWIGDRGDVERVADPISHRLAWPSSKKVNVPRMDRCATISRAKVGRRVT